MVDFTDMNLLQRGFVVKINKWIVKNGLDDNKDYDVIDKHTLNELGKTRLTDNEKSEIKEHLNVGWKPKGEVK